MMSLLGFPWRRAATYGSFVSPIPSSQEKDWGGKASSTFSSGENQEVTARSAKQSHLGFLFLFDAPIEGVVCV